MKARITLKKALDEDTPLTERDKTQLLDYLRQAHGGKDAKQKITLTRRQTTEIKKADSTGKSRTIQVEVRKKRVLVKREATDADASPEPAKPVLDAEQIALREAEAKREAELAARQAEDAQRKRRKKEEEVAAEGKPAPEPKAAQEAPPHVVGTLHKPAVKPEEKAVKAEKKAKKQVKPAVWKEETVRRRTIKTRGDIMGGLGWRERRARQAAQRGESERQHAFSAPAEPVRNVGSDVQRTVPSARSL